MFGSILPTKFAAMIGFSLLTVFSYAQRPMNGFFGVNVHVDHDDSPDEFPQVVDWVRDYSDWPNFEPENNRYIFRNHRNGRSYDSLYKRIKESGVGNLLVIEDIPKWISPALNHKHAGGFAPTGGGPGVHSYEYKEAAEFFYQLTARYGSETINDSMLLTEDKLSGLNIVPAIEVMNEADGDTSWGNFVTIEQYAALLNAVYDGDKGAMGKGFGIKAADPSMQVSITGLGGNLTSLKKIVAAAGRCPFDIINLHFYAFRNVRENYRIAVPPEWSSLEKDMKETVAWRNQHAPGKPVWLTEIGWDTKAHNSEAVSEQESANYLIRSFLIALGAGVEKCFWYYWEDYDDRNPIVFSSMGLFENNSVVYSGSTKLKPKLTWWYLAFMRSILKDMNYIGNHSGKINKTVYDYRFQSPDGNTIVHVMWYCPPFIYPFRQLDPYPESETVEFTAPENIRSLTVLEPEADDLKGLEKQSIKGSQSKLKLSLTGTPIFIVMKK
jgi:hypothetical protein